jgi:hypothetical protein
MTSPKFKKGDWVIVVSEHSYLGVIFPIGKSFVVDYCSYSHKPDEDFIDGWWVYGKQSDGRVSGIQEKHLDFHICHNTPLYQALKEEENV